MNKQIKKTPTGTVEPARMQRIHRIVKFLRDNPGMGMKEACASPSIGVSLVQGYKDLNEAKARGLFESPPRGAGDAALQIVGMFNGGMSQSDIAHRLLLSREAVRYYLTKAKRSGLVSRTGGGRSGKPFRDVKPKARKQAR
jgi:transposase